MQTQPLLSSLPLDCRWYQVIVAGSISAHGIFIVSADITRNVGGAGWLILVWAITGFMTLTAAVSYGELSAMYPKPEASMFT